ncbi:MAG: CBS domain-containing protein [Nanoarchaeota archaeon]
MKVKDAMTKNPVHIGPDELLPSCARKMLINNVGGILVVKNSELLGIVTEKDIVERAVAKELNSKKTKVKDIMSSGMITIKSNTNLRKVIDIMNKEDMRRLPVVDNGNLVGLITMKDVVRKSPELFGSIKKEFLKKRKK